MSRSKQLIVTGDDFGLAVPVNEAIEIAHQRGILSSASLMVGAAAVMDAVKRAKRLPRLKVGLHLTLVQGQPVLPAEAIPDLVTKSGEFYTNLVGAGFRFFFQPGIRQQLKAEIRAQFQAFHDTGLPLDYVNTHNHMHLHPTVLGVILEVGRDFGLAAMRVPFEPVRACYQAVPLSLKIWTGRAVETIGLAPWTSLLKARLRHAQIKTNDYVLGLQATGAMNESTVLSLLEIVPKGVTEMYFHPASQPCPEFATSMPNACPEQELVALVSPKVKEALARLDIQTITFSDI